MFKDFSKLAVEERKHLRDSGVYRQYGCTQFAVDQLYKAHKESDYPLCEECQRILIILGYKF